MMQEKNRNNLSLKDLVDIKDWKKIQDNFSDVTCVGLRTLDTKGETITLPSIKPRLCYELIEDPLIKEKVCGLCLPTFLGGKAIVDKNLSFSCQAGLNNFISPLRLRGKVLGYLVVGPVILVMRKPKDEYRKAAEKLNLDLEDFWNAILEIKVLSFYSVRSLMELIKNVGEYTLKLAYQSKIKEKVMIIPESPKLKKLLEVLLDVAFQVSKADIGSIMFFDKKKDALTIRVSKGIPDGIVRNTRVKIGEGISGLAVKEEASFLIDDSLRDNRIRAYLNRPYIKSSMVLPIKVEERVVGVMNLGTLERSLVRFDRDNIKLMHRLIDLATVVITSPSCK